MSISKSGVFNTVSSTLLLMILLSAGLYMVALNPRLAGFDVQASGSHISSVKSQESVNQRISLVPSNDDTGYSSHQQLACLSWYKSKKGDTQWGLAKRYSKQANKWPWIKGMREASGKDPKDDVLKTNEVVCVAWQALKTNYHSIVNVM